MRFFGRKRAEASTSVGKAKIGLNEKEEPLIPSKQKVSDGLYVEVEVDAAPLPAKKKVLVNEDEIPNKASETTGRAVSKASDSVDVSAVLPNQDTVAESSASSAFTEIMEGHANAHSSPREKPIAQKKSVEDDGSMWIPTKIPNPFSRTLWARARNQIAALAPQTPEWPVKTPLPKNTAQVASKEILPNSSNSTSSYEEYTEKPRSRLPQWLQAPSLPSTVCLATLLGLLAGGGTALLLAKGTLQPKTLNVAIIGNSIFYVNDFPRMFEAMGNGNIYQDSCLHPSGSLLKILKTGNGMWQRWQTSAAELTSNYTNGNGNSAVIYDFGACSVPQLMTGHDKLLSYGNSYGSFYDDGSNPCLEDAAYLDYTESFSGSTPWDYAVITDHTKRMCFQDSRQEALKALNYTYIPLFIKSGAVPVIVQPHAFWTADLNTSSLGDIANFTASIMEGAVEYSSLVASKLPSGQKPRIAPVGHAFLAVYEDDKSLWNKLFLSDYIHPSPYGSFLYGCVIYATIYGTMPKSSVADDTAELFADARRLQETSNATYPTQSEADYLMNIARKVALNKYLPASLPDLTNSSSQSYYNQNNQDSGYYD